jgi:hypothetical protein
VLAEYPTTLDAVLCAVEIQPPIARRNADISEDGRIPFRLGVALEDNILAVGKDASGPTIRIRRSTGVVKLNPTAA